MTDDQLELTEYQRGLLKGLDIAEKLFSSELSKEMKREGSPFPNEYKECAAFINILMPKRFEEFTLKLLNKWITKCSKNG